MKISKNRIALHATALIVFALAGCTTAVKKNEDASVIKQRAVQRWDYLIAHQAEKAYDFLTPGYRATKSRKEYAKEMNNRGLHWEKVTFASQKCEKDVCHVHLAVPYTYHIAGPIGVVHSIGVVNETWLRVNGVWYYLPNLNVPTKLGHGGG